MKNNEKRKSKYLKSILSVFLIFALVFTALPLVNRQEHEKNARTPLSKVIITSAKEVNGNITLKWKKVSCKGYQIYRSRNGNKYIKFDTVKSGTSYTDDTLSGDEGKLQYKVRAYNKHKQKQYYNTKKKKWVTKKPKKSQWKGRKTRKVTKTKTGNFSSVQTFYIGDYVDEPTGKDTNDENTGNDSIDGENGETPTTPSNPGGNPGLETDSSIPAPTNLRMTSNTAHTITIQWDAVTDATKYNVYLETVTMKGERKWNLLDSTSNTTYTVTKWINGTQIPKNTIHHCTVAAVKNNKEGTRCARTEIKTGTGAYFSVKENIKLAYSANNSDTKTTIYLGETWSDTIKSSLSTGSSMDYVFDRGDLYFECEDNKIGHPQKSYVFDAGDYDNYLVVNVCENQIIGWYTNAKVQAIVNGEEIRQGQNKTFDEQYNLVRYTYIVAPLLEPFNKEEYEDNGVVISGAVMYKDEDGEDMHTCPSDGNTYYESPTLNRWHEKQIGLHIINAYRVLSNRRGHKLNPLEYNKYLDGTESSDGSYILYTGDIEVWYANGTEKYDHIGAYHVENQAFGAQGFVDTLTASKPVNTTLSMHNMGMRSSSPCGGANKNLENVTTDWTNMLYSCGHEKAKGTTLEYNGLDYGNAAYGGVGESALTSYTSSAGHLTWYTADNEELNYIGIGLKDGYNQVFGSSK